nr:immunoglobulin light chain junction region [Macaca mulatta]MOW51850.1 immunoglobulin light chain junction region [Macaca mulatta]MOW52018.1 immunoglobulin light chain junction region [Macaca mulatta]MOW52372.1 immunoglobulin light chain junction region [Macaca mulatta]MOW52425.1 immunoglobulin light chain junction region [Macaca mulatta]
CMQAREFPWTF